MGNSDRSPGSWLQPDPHTIVVEEEEKGRGRWGGKEVEPERGGKGSCWQQWNKQITIYNFNENQVFGLQFIKKEKMNMKYLSPFTMGMSWIKIQESHMAEEPLEHSLNVKNMFFKKDCALKHFNTHNSWKYGFFLFFFRSNNCSSILIHFWFWDFLDTFKTEVKSDKVAVPLAKALWKY